MRSLSASCLLVASLAGCASSVPDAPSQVSRGIIGGAADSGDPAIVLLISYPTDQSTFFTCTAELVSPSVLLTAAHCVDATNHPGYVFGVFLGSDASAYATASALAPQLVAVKEVHAHPSYDPQAPFTADIGVVVLDTAQSLAPLPFQRAPLTSAIVGQPARLVGYGQTQYQQFNDSKYAAATTVQSLGQDDTVTVGDALHHSCVGDSGGPALAMMNGVETIIGVDSYTDVAGCTAPSHYRRVDLYQSFIDPYLPPAPDLGAAPVDAAVDAAAQPDLAMEPRGRSSGCSLVGAGPVPSGGAPALLLLLALLLRAVIARRRGRGVLALAVFIGACWAAVLVRATTAERAAAISRWAAVAPISRLPR
jgi:hypothetical protein